MTTTICSLRWTLLAPVVAVLAACGGTNERSAIDDALSRDIALAATTQPPQHFISPLELGYAQQYPQQYPQGYYPQGYPAQPVQVASRAPAAPRASSGRASSGTIYRAPDRREPVRHTKRDAMIGAAAGAVAGAAIGRDVKGALIGAAAGGLLGAVVGHTIDVEKP